MVRHGATCIILILDHLEEPKLWQLSTDTKGMNLLYIPQSQDVNASVASQTPEDFTTHPEMHPLKLIIHLICQTSDGLVGTAGAKRCRGPGFETALVALSVKKPGFESLLDAPILCSIARPAFPPFMGSRGVNGRQIISVLLGGLCTSSLE